MVWETSVFYLESLEEERCVSKPKEERSKVEVRGCSYTQAETLVPTRHIRCEPHDVNPRGKITPKSSTNTALMEIVYSDVNFNSFYTMPRTRPQAASAM